MSNPDLALIFLVAAYFIGKKFYEKVKKDGYQPTDVTEAITEGSAELKALVTSIEGVAKDITVNDADSVKTIISMIDAKKKL